ncbi:MAG: nuclear transport factor 2 family protein [Acidobacteriota bacterium]|nr:nuclear transport factor 2 family protein [Acidobacteriota bacterium]
MSEQGQLANAGDIVRTTCASGWVLTESLIAIAFVSAVRASGGSGTATCLSEQYPPANAGGSDKRATVKRCPTCNKTFTDRNLSFCIDDGTPLVPVVDPPDEVTLVLPSAGEAASRSAGPSTAGGEGSVAPYQPPGTYAPPGFAPPKRRVWPWILGLLLLIVLVIVGMGIVAWFYFQPLKYITANTNISNTNANVDRGDNGNWNLNNSNSNSTDENQNVNDNSDAAEATPAPTDEAAVLADLTNLEHEWTVANINADKTKLNRILADDYVGTSEEGRSEGKAEYLRTIKRNTTIQKWVFEDLKVSLKGDRATLTGILRLKIQNQDVAYRFVDKFVWRDGRWQATGSEVTPLK